MKKTRYLFLTCLLLLCATALHARGGREKTPPPRIVQITGVVRLVGSSLFPELVITNAEGDIFVAEEEIGKLYDFQQRVVTVEGEMTEIEMRFASGISAGTRRILRNVRVIAVQ